VDHVICIHRNTLANAAHISGMEKAETRAFQWVFKRISNRLEIGRRHVAEVRKFLKAGWCG
jgi:two-component system, LytTR family, response regulator AlgR